MQGTQRIMQVECIFNLNFIIFRYLYLILRTRLLKESRKMGIDAKE